MLNNVLFMLLGAGLVALGVLTMAYAERLRGDRAMQRRDRAMTSATQKAPPTAWSNPPSPTPAEMPRTPTVTRAARAPRQTTPNPGDEVITALMEAGYKRSIAAGATWACSEAERATLERWTASALRRCGQRLA